MLHLGDLRCWTISPFLMRIQTLMLLPTNSSPTHSSLQWPDWMRCTLPSRHLRAYNTYLPRVYWLLDDLGLSGLLICTPVEFLGGSSYDEEPNP